jgi:hypothetical protein
MQKGANEKLGISIRGGAKGSKGNPLDREDEGIFISKVLFPMEFSLWDVYQAEV